MLKRWVPWASVGIYGVLLLVATVRARLKFGGETAGGILGFGLVFSVVLWRAWRYAAAILFGGQAQFFRLVRPSAASRKAGVRRKT